MCVPLAALAVGSVVASTLVSAYGQVKAGNYAEAAAKEQARGLARAADDAKLRGELSAGQTGQEYQGLIGSQRAQMGAAGLDLQSGSPLEVLLGTAQVGEQDVQTIRNNAAREAWGYQSERRNVLAQGRLAKYSGRFGAAGTILGGAAQAASIYKALK